MPAAPLRSYSKSCQEASVRWTSSSFREPAMIRNVTPSDLPTPSAQSAVAPRSIARRALGSWM